MDPLRVLVVSESFLPQVNGVTNSVRRVLEHLEATGHTAMLVAPSGPPEYAGAPVRLVRSVSLPSYREFPIGTATPRTLRNVLWAFDPDVVHLASPAWLGLQATLAARSRSVPVVAVYQTDLIGFAERYPIPGGAAAMRRLTRSVHGSVDRTLVPSTASHDQLAGLGIGRLHRWGRGVDTELFAPSRRTDELRAQLGAEHVVGYVGRLAAEKELDLLAAVQDLPGTRLVVVGGGPEDARLRSALPRARFLGVRQGLDLARIVASLDVFVHTGRTETLLPVRSGGARLRCPGRRAARGRPGRPGERGRQRLPLPTRGAPGAARARRRAVGRSGTAQAPGSGRAGGGDGPLVDRGERPAPRALPRRGRPGTSRTERLRLTSRPDVRSMRPSRSLSAHQGPPAPPVSLPA